jgi:putative nucleotidyltransferase with HDIG domain
VEVPVADEHILMDTDTPTQYEELLRRQATLGLPTPAECEAMLSLRFSYDPAIIRHSRAVAELAETLAGLLGRCGQSLNMDLIRAGGMLHDIAKGEPNHPDKGAALLRGLGFPDVADLIEAHMNLTWITDQDISPRELIYLADKLVLNEYVVPLSKKFERSAERFRHDPAAMAALHERRRTAESIKQAVEAIIGRRLEDILPELHEGQADEQVDHIPSETR